jgi:hypothetical protein
MKREIKFKLWHKETGAFLKVWPYEWKDGVYTNGKPNRYFDNKFEVTPDGMECNRIEGKSVFLTIDGTVIGLIPISDTITKSLYYHDEYEILQFTGLHDCNGKEIYTDSVVKFKYMVSLDHSIDLIGRLFYDDTELRYQIEIYNNENYTVLNYMYNGTMYDFEEIGSIYEHPELLNK